jgi:hypothetical protein
VRNPGIPHLMEGCGNVATSSSRIRVCKCWHTLIRSGGDNIDHPDRAVRKTAAGAMSDAYGREVGDAR